MIISEKQLIMLMETLTDTLKLGDFPFTYSYETRLDLANKILNQQSQKLIEVKDAT